MITKEQVSNLEYSWTAEVQLQNGVKMSIWYTAWPMTQKIVSKILSISSDYPKHKISK